jgi:O-antigen ligase
VAVSNGTGDQDFLKTLSLTSGQPLAYAGFLVLFAVTLQSRQRSRQDLLRAWAVVMIVEGLYVAAQFATGSAYDPLRGFSRGQGTTGADFLGAFAAISFFGALALRSIERSTSGRLLAWAAMIAAAGSQLASTSRASLVGLILGLAYMLVQRRRGGVAGSHRNVALVLSLIAIIGGGLYATKDLWLSRLDARPTTTFDRAATWASGLRIARDHPSTGVGPTKLEAIIGNDPRYSDTQYGRTTSVPHDMWIFALAVGGLPYGLGAVWVAFVLFRVLRQAPRLSRSQEVLGLRAALIAALPVFVINNVFTHPEVMIVVTLAVALLVVPPRPDARGAERSTVPRPAWHPREFIPARP